MGIDTKLRNDIVHQFKESLHYSNPLIVKHGNKEVDVTCAVGEDACSPDVEGLPLESRKTPKDTHYRFDSKFRGEDSFDGLFKMLNDACTDCSLYVQKRNVSRPRTRTQLFEIRCSCYKLQKELDNSDFDDGCFSKKGTKIETVKKQPSANQQKVTDRMSHYKLKSSKNGQRTATAKTKGK